MSRSNRSFNITPSTSPQNVARDRERTVSRDIFSSLFQPSCCVRSTSFPGSLFSTSLSRWNRDPGYGRSRDIYPSKTAGWVGTQGYLVERKTLLPHPSSRFFYHPDSGWSHDQLRPGSLFQRPREAEKRDPGNEVGVRSLFIQDGKPF